MRFPILFLLAALAAACIPDKRSGNQPAPDAGDAAGRGSDSAGDRVDRGADVPATETPARDCAPEEMDGRARVPDAGSQDTGGKDDGALDNEVPHDSAAPPGPTEFQVNVETARDQRSPSLEVLSNGNFVVSWMSCPINWNGGTLPSQDDTGCGIFARVFSQQGAALTPADVPINTAEVSHDQKNPTVVDVNGSFAIAWISFNEVDGLGPVVRLYWDASSPASDEVRVEGAVAGTDDRPDLVMMEDTSFVIVWLGQDPATDDYLVYYQRFSYVEEKFVPSAAGPQVLSAGLPTSQGFPRVIRTDDYLALFDVSSESGSNLKGQVISFGGALVGDPFNINAEEWDGMLPATAAAWGPAGAYVTARLHSVQDGHDIAVRQFDALNKPAGPDFSIAPESVKDVAEPEMAVFPGGEAGPKRIALTWQRAGKVGVPDPEDVFVALYELQAVTGKPEIIGDEIQCNSFTKGSQARPEVGVFEGGGFVVVWQSCPFNFDPGDMDEESPDLKAGQDGHGCGIYAQLFDKDGLKIPLAAPR